VITRNSYGALDARCAEVQRVHDEPSRARTDLPLA